jgi:hypothetical protein
MGDLMLLLLCLAYAAVLMHLGRRAWDLWRSRPSAVKARYEKRRRK